MEFIEVITAAEAEALVLDVADVGGTDTDVE